MSSSSQLTSDFAHKLQTLDNESAPRNTQRSESSQSRSTLVQDRLGRFRPSDPSTKTNTLKRRREGKEDETTAHFPNSRLKRPMRRRSTLASDNPDLPRSNQMDSVYNSPPSSSLTHDTSEGYARKESQFHYPPSEHERILHGEKPVRPVPKNLDYLPDASDAEESENGGMLDEIGEDAGQQPEEGDLTRAFKSLTVGMGGVFEESGDQYDDNDGSRCAPVYPDSLGNIG